MQRRPRGLLHLARGCDRHFLIGEAPRIQKGLCFFNDGLAVDLAFIVYKAVGPDAGRQLVRQSEYFCDINAVGNTCDIARRPVKSIHQSGRDRVSHRAEHNGHILRCRSRALGRTRSNGHDHINALCGELLRDGADGRGISLCVFINDLHRIAARSRAPGKARLNGLPDLVQRGVFHLLEDAHGIGLSGLHTGIRTRRGLHRVGNGYTGRSPARAACQRQAQHKGEQCGAYSVFHCSVPFRVQLIRRTC